MIKSVPFSEITFCIKTIHRPWACQRLVKSIHKHFDKPKIIVVDDGRDELRFSAKYPRTAKQCRVIDLPHFDVGIGVGRNTAIDAATTEYVFLLDDDHVVTSELRLDQVRERFTRYDFDILGVRQGNGGRPVILSSLMNGKRISICRGKHRSLGPLAWCDMTSNAFLAKRETIANLRWDPAIKVFEHWEFFYRAKLKELAVAIATDCSIHHAHVSSNGYRALRERNKFRSLGLRKHGFHSMRNLGGKIVHV